MELLTDVKLSSSFTPRSANDTYVYWRPDSELMVRVTVTKSWPAPGESRVLFVATRLDVDDRPWRNIYMTPEMRAATSTRQIATLVYRDHQG